MTQSLNAELAANVWKILVQVGDAVVADEPLMILESMKMEIPVVSDEDGTVVAIHVAEGDNVNMGQLLLEYAAE